MFWNPAAVSFLPGMQMEGNVSYIAPHASIDVISARSALGTESRHAGRQRYRRQCRASHRLS